MMLFQTHKKTQVRDIFYWNLKGFCHSIEIPGNQNLKDPKGYKGAIKQIHMNLEV